MKPDITWEALELVDLSVDDVIHTHTKSACFHLPFSTHPHPDYQLVCLKCAAAVATTHTECSLWFYLYTFFPRLLLSSLKMLLIFFILPSFYVLKIFRKSISFVHLENKENLDRGREREKNKIMHGTHPAYDNSKWYSQKEISRWESWIENENHIDVTRTSSNTSFSRGCWILRLIFALNYHFSWREDHLTT